MKKTVKLLSVLMVICIFLSSCAQSAVGMTEAISVNVKENYVAENVVRNDRVANNANPEKGTYSEGVALVKYDGEIDEAMLAELNLVSATPLYNGSVWYTVELQPDADTIEIVSYLRELGCFDEVDYDYIMATTGPKEEENPNYDDQVNLGLSNIPNGWTHNGKAPGGSPDVVIAVIDTGVDYNHADLKNNIWVNPAEIPDNGRDDDGNGYVDDVYGWDFVGNDKDPMDDNGHGTHVAGIIAAENNKVGGIGVAYNCKVMVLKAGNSSGYFNNSDIAEAIQYAYMNGASVINMSFGGSNISIAVEDALENAYNTSILVAAAGNDGACNNLACPECGNVGVTYPAALPYVIGVMSTDKDGKHLSSFSNYDHNPYDSIEYEVYAVGEGVGSTWPSDKYACLNGTSMAAPTVAGIAALLRSYYSDREVYSTKFIQSQIVNTGTINPHMSLMGDGHVTDTAHSVADVVEAMTKLPKPAVNLYDYYIDDSISIGNKNNGNGVIDAGETVRLYISLHNRGGVASGVNVSIDTDRGMGMTDPYFTFINNTIQLSDIGTYSVRECYEDQYFEIVVDADCPNDYLVDFNIRFTYTNGLDANDKTTYSDDGKQKAQFNVSRGYLLPSTITEDTTYTADRLYIVGQDVVIPEGVTVIFEEGCEIQFYDDRAYYNSPEIIVYGELYINGSQHNMVSITPSERYMDYLCIIHSYGTTVINYLSSMNLHIVGYESRYGVPSKLSDFNTTVTDSILRENSSQLNFFSKGDTSPVHFMDEAGVAKYVNCYIEKIGAAAPLSFGSMENCLFLHSGGNNFCLDEFKNNIVVSFGYTSFYDSKFYGIVQNNMFLTLDEQDPKTCISLVFENKDEVRNNLFDTIYKQFGSQVIEAYYDAAGLPTVDLYSKLSEISLLWPHVVSVEMFDKNDNPITTVGREEIKVRVTFNRAMDTTQDTFLTFGTIEPYADYRINGTWVSDTVWEGSYSLKTQIENGQNFLKVNNACAAEDHTKVVFGEYQLHEFTIDTTAAMSASLVANPTSKGIELSWMQDDYDTLMGYNVYRSMTKDGNYVKINPAILLSSDDKFIDSSVEPGVTYWYTFTTVLSDFTESNPAGITSATAIDSIPPIITHTPIAQGYFNQNLSISCNVTDNIQVTAVTLYYRTFGTTEWHKLSMTKANNKYGATIYGSALSFDGLEYYIVASDGVGEALMGSAAEPIRVTIKHAYQDHVFTGEWLFNDNGHWRICSVCGESENIASHIPGAAATEMTPQTCTACGYIIKAALGHKVHSFGTTYVTNEYQHWYECACGVRDGIENHVYDNACDTACNTCGATREIRHIYGGNYVVNEYQHWYECACGAKQGIENHAFDNACDADCNTCGITRTITHSYGSNYISDGHQHWHECACGAKEGIEDHVYDNVCDTNCNKCGATRTVEHSYGSDYIINEYQHWYECSCGAKGNVENHVFDNAQDADCNKCGFTRKVEIVDNTEKQSGCGSTISGAYVGAITLVSVFGALALKKKKED